VRERLDEADADHERGDGERDWQEAPLGCREDDEAERAREVRGAVRPSSRRTRSLLRSRSTTSAARDEIEEHDHEDVGGRERAEEAETRAGGSGCSRRRC
jgi:hypothetical protein